MEGAVLIVLAAGSGERLGLELPKAFVRLGARSLLAHSVAAATACPSIASVVVVVPGGWEERAREALEPAGPHRVVAGGASRQASVRAGLAAIPEDARVVICHDAARPFTTPTLFDAVIEALEGFDGVVPAVPVPDTVKRVRRGVVIGTEPREDLALAQTPQAFLSSALRDAHERAERDGVALTDDAMALELAGYRVRVVEGDPRNFKITTPEDLARAELVLAGIAHG